MARVVVQKLLVLFDLPEDYLSVHAAWDNSVLRVGVDGHNISSVTVVRIHIVHIPQVPYFKRSVLRDSVKLIIFSIHGDASNSISVSKELRDLLLVMDVPDTYDSIFTSGDHQFTVGRDGWADYFVKMPSVALVPPISSKELFGLSFNVPPDEGAVLRPSDERLVIGHPF
jgi:hypothetical protein